MRVFTTAPASARSNPRAYLKTITDLAYRHECAGVEGMLLYTENRLIDPWTVAQAILATTSTFVPLVATQPVYMHPFTAARKVSSLGLLYGRKLALNMVTGGTRRDLVALGDKVDHDCRYERLTEYIDIMSSLLCGETTTYRGQYFQVENLNLTPTLDSSLVPELFLAGASQASIAATIRTGAVRLSYTKPPEEIELNQSESGARGLRIGIIAREESQTAWEVALTRFPADRRGQLAHRLATRKTDSDWYRQIADFADSPHYHPYNVYWLGPLQNHKTYCPYLVGGYDDVADYILRYQKKGYSVIILDVLHDKCELDHTMKSLELAGCI